MNGIWDNFLIFLHFLLLSNDLNKKTPSASAWRAGQDHQLANRRRLRRQGVSKDVVEKDGVLNKKREAQTRQDKSKRVKKASLKRSALPPHHTQLAGDDLTLGYTRKKGKPHWENAKKAAPFCLTLIQGGQSQRQFAPLERSSTPTVVCAPREIE